MSWSPLSYCVCVHPQRSGRTAGASKLEHQASAVSCFVWSCSIQASPLNGAHRTELLVPLWLLPRLADCDSVIHRASMHVEASVPDFLNRTLAAANAKPGCSEGNTTFWYIRRPIDGKPTRGCSNNSKMMIFPSKKTHRKWAAYCCFFVRMMMVSGLCTSLASFNSDHYFPKIKGNSVH
jgi:hypothetical protein